MINEIEGVITLTSPNTELFVQDIIKLTQEGCVYKEYSAFMGMMGNGVKKATFLRKAPQAISFAELPPEKTPEASLKVADEDLKEKVDQSTSSSQEPSESSSTDSESSSTKILPDWEIVKNLRNGEDLKLSKDNLAEYAKTFGVVLKKNMTFENMVKKFEETL